jgi:uncharacterized membrane protein
MPNHTKWKSLGLSLLFVLTIPLSTSASGLRQVENIEGAISEGAVTQTAMAEVETAEVAVSAVPIRSDASILVSSDPSQVGHAESILIGSGEGVSEEASIPVITNDIVLFGVLMAILAIIFYTSSSQHPSLQRFYRVVPVVLLCYLLPSLLTLLGLVDPEASQLPSITKKCLLPTSLILLTLCTDLKAVFKLGPKALIMFLTGTISVVVGGPIAILVVAPFAPDLVGGVGADAVWRGLATVAGSWIGGGANMVAMKEVFEPSESLYSVMIAVDIFVAELWMIFLVLGVGKAEAIDRRFGADDRSVRQLQQKMEDYSAEVARIPSTADLFLILGTGFGITAACHVLADVIGPWIETHAPDLNRFSLNSSFFWLIVLATTFGLALSFTPARRLEGAGASKIGTVCIYLLVATIGLQMDLRSVVKYPGLFLVGTIWMLFHVLLLVIVGRVIRAPYFFLAVGSKANIGGAASAPVIAAAFHPSLAPVGVLLAVVGYALGTYAAYISALLMQLAASSPT